MFFFSFGPTAILPTYLMENRGPNWPNFGAEAQGDCPPLSARQTSQSSTCPSVSQTREQIVTKQNKPAPAGGLGQSTILIFFVLPGLRGVNKHFLPYRQLPSVSEVSMKKCIIRPADTSFLRGCPEGFFPTHQMARPKGEGGRSLPIPRGSLGFLSGNVLPEFVRLGYSLFPETGQWR